MYRNRAQHDRACPLGTNYCDLGHYIGFQPGPWNVLGLQTHQDGHSKQEAAAGRRGNRGGNLIVPLQSALSPTRRFFERFGSGGSGCTLLRSPYMTARRANAQPIPLLKSTTSLRSSRVSTSPPIGRASWRE